MATFSALSSSRYAHAIREDDYNRTWILIRWAGSGKRVLELGCANGYVSQRLADNKCEVVGVEVDQDSAEYARNFCASVIVADLNALDWAQRLHGQTFDVILMGDVLEHLVSPDKVLRAVRPLLHASGCLLISLPNLVHWLTRLQILFGRFEYQPEGTLDCTHLRFFTPKTARELIRGAGYSVTRFHPAIGGRLSGHLRPLWQWLANRLPGLFAYQLLFEARI